MNYRKPSWAVRLLRRETGLVENLCEHGVGHPNEDWLTERAKSHPLEKHWGVHGCDGCCCNKELESEIVSERAIFQATFSKTIQVSGRKVVQFVFEVPTEAADQALKALGGYQATINETWVAIALLNPKAVQRPPEKALEPKKHLTLSQESALLCEEKRFHTFLAEEYAIADPVDAAQAVRDLCGVASRSQFDHDPEAAQRWRELEGRYRAWYNH